MKLRRPGRPLRHAAILGCGPAGLFSAHALAVAGWTFDIFSRKRRSELFGAQYLHEPIPKLNCGAGSQISYTLTGTIAEYRAKVYGPTSTVTTSPEILVGTDATAWDIRSAYHDAWDRYASNIFATEITPDWIIDGIVPVMRSKYSLLVISIPADQICLAQLSRGSGIQIHTFRSQQAWAIGDAPERGVYAPFSVKPGTVNCNGERDVGWYRTSNIFGYQTVEWPSTNKPPISHVAEVQKPISTNCNCWGRLPMIRVGRYGRWDKFELSHMAFPRTLAAIE